VKVADLLSLAFAEAGHDTRVCHSGEAGLRCLDEARPDAVFLDIRLPNMSGIEVLRRIRASDTVLPVVLITGNATPEDRAAAARLGVTDIIEKPYVLNNMTGALERITSEADPR